MKILELTLTKKYYDMILSGVKREEYREIKPYWFRRLVYKPERVMEYLNRSEEFICEMVKKTHSPPEHYIPGILGFVPFDRVRFRNGYGKHRPSFEIELKGIMIGPGQTELGAESGYNYFVLKLVEIIK